MRKVVTDTKQQRVANCRRRSHAMADEMKVCVRRSSRGDSRRLPFEASWQNVSEDVEVGKLLQLNQHSPFMLSHFCTRRLAESTPPGKECVGVNLSDIDMRILFFQVLLQKIAGLTCTNKHIPRSFCATTLRPHTNLYVPNTCEKSVCLSHTAANTKADVYTSHCSKH